MGMIRPTGQDNEQVKTPPHRAARTGRSAGRFWMDWGRSRYEAVVAVPPHAGARVRRSAATLRAPRRTTNSDNVVSIA
jgi:hypothetical protein